MPLPSLKELSLKELMVAKHTKGNKDGFKAERQSIRVLSKSAFVRCSDAKASMSTCSVWL